MTDSPPAARPGAEAEWTDLGPCDPDQPVRVSLLLRPRGDTATPPTQDLGLVAPRLRAHLSREQLVYARGPDPQDLAAVRSWAQRAGLELGPVSPGPRTVAVAGPLGRMAGLFGVELRRVRHQGRELRVSGGEPSLPEPIRDAVVAVLGLATLPLARPHFRPLPLPARPGPLAEAAPLSYLPPALAGLYRFPEGTSGSGACIGLIELGGGFRPDDVSTYFTQLGVQEPELVAVPVDGAANQPTGVQDGPDGEVMLDIELAGSMAPGVRLAVYFAPNTDQGFLDAVNQALQDQVNRPSVLSISWGGPEANWPASTMTAFDQVFQDAALLGVTVCAAAGDSGSGDGLSDGLAHVDFPASSPHVLACGGTRLSSAAGQITAEVTWNDGSQGGATGGGVSAEFPLPSWQDAARVPASADPGHAIGRGVPDVAADADPETGYQVLVDGEPAVFGGTSAVGPLWAALLVRCGQALGQPCGYLNPILYQRLAGLGVTRDVVKGDNGAYSAGPGWDPCTGWGSPIGELLLEGLRQDGSG